MFSSVSVHSRDGGRTQSLVPGPFLEGEGVEGTPVRSKVKVSPPTGQHMTRTGYAAGGTPLALTQQDFLLYNYIFKLFSIIYLGQW